MSLAIEKVALYAPIIASSTIFACRRINRGLDAMDDNPFFGTANFAIAGGQTLKGVKAAKDLTYTTKMPSAAESITASSTALKGLSTSSKFLQFIGKTLNFISNNINPLICVASGIKVLGSDDKADAAVREILGDSTMFLFEGVTKRMIGMPIYKSVNGVMKSTPRQANPFFEKQVQAIDDLLRETALFKNVSSSSMHGALKGLIFVLASIAGYKVGNKIADLLIGEKADASNKNAPKRIVMNTNNCNTQTYVVSNAA